jgi:Zn-dependent M28 family amino/carboxypeptidase
VPLSRIVANVNLDGLAFLYDFRDIVALGADHSNIAAIVDDVARHMRLEVSPDPTPEEVSFIRSDQYSFVKKGVPAVFINDGYKTVDPKLDGKKMWDDWEATRYHKPNDDMNQPLDFDGAVKATRVNLAVGYELAQQPGRPRWNAGDFFEKLATQRAAGSN